jgi:diguanylate cyclase (GGDEF)-like protein
MKALRAAEKKEQREVLAIWKDYKARVRSQHQEVPRIVRTLVVDDDPNFLFGLVELLRMEGYDAYGELSAPEGLKFLTRSKEPTMIITDVFMKPNTGLEFLELVRDGVRLFTQRVCISSSPKMEQRAIDAGATWFLKKPENREEYYELLRQLRPVAQTIRDHYNSAFDALTGLPREESFDQSLRDEISRTKRAKSCVSLLFLDGDGLKSINTTYGHDAGSAFIARIGEILRSRLRAGDSATRYDAGDEFLVFLHDTDKEHAELAAASIAAEVASHPIEHDGRVFDVSVSVGCGTVRWNDIGGGKAAIETALRQLKKAADESMYRLKNGDGRLIGVR